MNFVCVHIIYSFIKYWCSGFHTETFVGGGEKCIHENSDRTHFIEW